MTAVQKVTQALTAPLDPASFLPMVESQARRLARRLPAHVELGDLVSAGVLGLMEAMRRYDPRRSVAFQSYAAFRVRGAMLDELRRRDLMARDARRECKQVQAAIHDLRVQLGRSPETFELAEAMGTDVASLELRLQKLPFVSISSIDEAGVDEPSETRPSAYDQAVDKQLQQRLVAALRFLPERSQQVLQLYYHESLTLKQIGQVLEISESRVSQIMSKATLELRDLMADEPKKD